jgi:hypothetical protein
MKKSLSIICICATLAFTACKGNPGTQAGDSTGTGASGARVPGNNSTDTTKHDSTNTSPKKAIYKDSTKTDSTKK